jgi:hypothetical protein
VICISINGKITSNSHHSVLVIAAGLIDVERVPYAPELNKATQRGPQRRDS